MAELIPKLRTVSNVAHVCPTGTAAFSAGRALHRIHAPAKREYPERGLYVLAPASSAAMMRLGHKP